MSQSGKFRFVGVVRTQNSFKSIPLEAEDEASATEALKARYGTENIIEVRSGEANAPDQMSQAEADVQWSVNHFLPKALFALVKWVLKGSFGK